MDVKEDQFVTVELFHSRSMINFVKGTWTDITRNSFIYLNLFSFCMNIVALLNIYRIQ